MALSVSHISAELQVTLLQPWLPGRKLGYKAPTSFSRLIMKMPQAFLWKDLTSTEWH